MKASIEFEFVVEGNEAVITRYLGTNQHVEVPDMVNGLRVVGVDAQSFAGAPLQTVSFPDSLRRLNMDALKGCTKLVEVSLPAGIEHIGGCLQDGCPELKTLVLRGAALSPACMIAVSCLNGVETLYQYSAAGVEAWVTLKMKAICG